MYLQLSSIAPMLSALGFAATKSTTKTSSSSSIVFFVLLFLIVAAYLWIRPQRRRMRQQQASQRNFDIGDEVVTTSGIVGRVVANDGTRIDLEIAPGTTIQVLPQAIGRRIEPPTDSTFTPEQHGEVHHDERHEHADDEVGDSSKWWPSGSEQGNAGDSSPGGDS